MIEINSIQNNLPGLKMPKSVEKPGDEKFGNVLTDFIGQVNQQQFDADKITKSFIEGGNNVEIQDVMIAGEQAKTSLQLLMEIRNKAIDMYKTLTNMQI